MNTSIEKLYTDKKILMSLQKWKEEEVRKLTEHGITNSNRIIMDTLITNRIDRATICQTTGITEDAYYWYINNVWCYKHPAEYNAMVQSYGVPTKKKI